MKMAIVYASVHHGNTEKLVDEIAKNEGVDLMGIDSCGMLLSAIHNVNGEEKLS